jgi:hypothetical protein
VSCGDASAAHRHEAEEIIKDDEVGEPNQVDHLEAHLPEQEEGRRKAAEEDRLDEEIILDFPHQQHRKQDYLQIVHENRLH